MINIETPQDQLSLKNNRLVYSKKDDLLPAGLEMLADYQCGLS